MPSILRQSAWLSRTTVGVWLSTAIDELIERIWNFSIFRKFVNSYTSNKLLFFGVLSYRVSSSEPYEASNRLLRIGQLVVLIEKTEKSESTSASLPN